MRLNQKSVFEVVAMDATSTTLAVTFEQTAPAQKIAPPGMPTNVDVNLVSMTGGGSGRTTLNDGALVLVGEMSITSKVVMDIAAEGMNQRMTSGTEMKMTITRGKR
jgi:hypothetical protein